LLSMAVNFAMNWMLVGVLRERGLALSTSTVALLNFALLYLMMRRRIGSIEGRRTAITVAKILGASAAMAAVCWGTSSAIARMAGYSCGAKTVNVAASVTIGAAVFYAIARLLGVSELKLATDAIVGRFLRRFQN